MMNMPAISVIITAFNVEKYIGRCIRSILHQSRPRHDFEVIVINDCSSDRTRFALELFDKDIRLINNESRLGLPKSLNIGMRHARGHFVVRLDGDDYVNSEFLNSLALHLDMNSELDAVACDYLLVDDHENVLGKRNCLEHPIACGIMFRIEQLIEVGLYDEEFGFREEEDLRLRFEKKYSIVRVRLPLYRYRRHEGNITNNAAMMDHFKKKLEEKHNLNK